MGAIDVAAKVRAAAITAVDAGCFGEDFGVDTTVVVGQDPTGSVLVVYRIVLTLRSPLLGQWPLVNVSQIPSPNPTAEQVGQAVSQAMKGLRDLSSEILAGGQPAAVQPG